MWDNGSITVCRGNKLTNQSPRNLIIRGIGIKGPELLGIKKEKLREDITTNTF